ncbi:hypothetical protein AGMMS50230_02470 [Spirochaetia bacterium]|nr:hypothetical protein AGMMS50230_02470 [Spirochaetia bacterium]
MLENAKKTILAIDDDITILTLLRTILEGTFEVCLAKNAEIAMKILHTTRIDMILLDMKMPGLSGIELLDAIHQNTSFYYIPIIVVSSCGTPDVIVPAKKAGASDFIVKPIVPRTLLEKIHSTFKISAKKINHDILSRKLIILETACEQGKSSRVEEVVDELSQVYYNIATDLEIAEICKCAREMNYNLAAKKISKLLSGLSAR